MYTGPKLTNDNLVFGYDTGYGIADNGTKIRFYKGEPTTNILPSPEKNGRFTTENEWGSYNTNQYNSNNDFSIGTVSGISNNIVTLSSVGRTIRSFDVLNPATSGGGVTAGTNYVIKKISSTTFSLHAYNSSQNGSQGYINPTTGMHKVLDSYANDTRISISASGFPTMWHGAPHLPNSALIKEIVPNGGYVEGTNCLRLHVFRGDNVRDGMAYNVYCPVTQGDVITVSYWVRPVNSFAYGKTWNYQTYFGGNANSSFNTTLNSTGEWQHVVHQWTASVTYNFYSYWFPSGSTDKWAMDMADLQVEVNKGHATPFTLTSRSDTASLIDLKKTTDIDVGDVSFDSTGQPTFDGTDDYITMANNPQLGDSQASWEFVVKFDITHDDDTSEYRQLYIQENSIWIAQYLDKIGIDIRKDNNAWFDGNGGAVTGSQTAVVDANIWYHVVFTFNNGVIKGYLNNVLQFTTTVSGMTGIINGQTPRRIGRRTNQPLDGSMPVVRLYNTDLTALQVAQNFNAYKNRFNI